jgi:hypothetical protein
MDVGRKRGVKKKTPEIFFKLVDKNSIKYLNRVPQVF